MALYAGNNDIYVTFLDLTDTNGDAVTGATVEATIYQYNSTTVIAGPVTLNDDGSGAYSGTIQSPSLLIRHKYKVVFTVTKGGASSEWMKVEEAQQRSFDQ